MSTQEEVRKREEDKAVYRSHVDAIVEAYGRFGVPRPRREIVRELRQKSLLRLTETVGHELTPQQQQNVTRYCSIMDELARECDN